MTRATATRKLAAIARRLIARPRPGKPADATIQIDGLWYKVSKTPGAARNRVFRWNGEEWIASTRQPPDIAAAIVAERVQMAARSVS